MLFCTNYGSMHYLTVSYITRDCRVLQWSECISGRSDYTLFPAMLAEQP
jgi:hypothetical protein